MRAAVKAFSPSISPTYDGFHPRQLDCLSDAALDVLASLLNLTEDIGERPPGIAAVVTTLIPKPEGRTRPIGLCPGIYRCWARTRRQVAEQWERANDGPFFAAKEGNSALDTVADQAFRAERSVTAGRSAAPVLLDMRSFYEHFDHDALCQRANDSGLPMRVMRLALSAYRAPRLIAQEGKVAPPIRPRRGVISGCGFATTWVKVYCRGPF